MKNRKKKTSLPVGILIVAVAVAALFLIWNKDSVKNDIGTDTDSVEYKLDDSLSVTHIGSYTGPYMEDGSREEVSDVMMIGLTNVGEQTLQYAEITLSSEEEEALFKVSTLKPGETVRVLEAERKLFDDTITYTEASMKNVVYFEEELKLYEDILKVQPLDGGFNITNISEQDIKGEIMIYYKDVRDDILMGGITYRGRIENGLKAGEIKQIMSKNFSEENTKVVFITITEK